MSHWETFYKSHPPPEGFEKDQQLMVEFCTKFKNEKIVLVTVSACIFSMTNK